jgi:hypothetical protein
MAIRGGASKGVEVRAGALRHQAHLGHHIEERLDACGVEQRSARRSQV